MNAETFDRNDEFGSNFVIAVVSLLLIAAYACLFHVFQSDRQEGRAAMVEQDAGAPANESLSFQETD
jgi:hypothetical protein